MLRHWVLLDTERNFSLISKWKGPGSFSCVAYYRQHKAVPWIPMGVCLALEGTQPPADKQCQLAEGPYTSAMCSLLFNRTHSHCIRSRQRQTLSPGHLVFSSYLHLCQLKRLYYDGNCEAILRSVVEAGGGANRLLYFPFVSFHKRSQAKA